MGLRRCGLWYTVHNINNAAHLELFPELEVKPVNDVIQNDLMAWYAVTQASLAHSHTAQARPEPRVLAWDIECTKMPLKFPDAQQGDQAA